MPSFLPRPLRRTRQGGWSVLLLGALVASAPIRGQQSQNGNSADTPCVGCPEPQVDPQLARRQKRDLAQLHNKQLKKDADELFSLAQELKAATDKSSADVLSLQIVAKAGQIEKLAKRIKESMRDGR